VTQSKEFGKTVKKSEFDSGGYKNIQKYIFACASMRV
jgi:hypothetical protein